MASRQVEARVDAFESARYRVLGRLLRVIVTLLGSAAVTTAIVYTFNIRIAGRAILSNGYLYLLMALLVPITFLIFPSHRRARNRLPWYDILLAVLSFAVPFYFFLNSKTITWEGWEIGLRTMPLPGYIGVLVFWFIIIEGCRRATGLVFALFILIVSLYPLFAGSMPGMLRASNFTLDRIAGYYMASADGLIGIVMGIMGKLLVGFLFFAAALVATGGGSAFLNCAMALVGMVRGGPAKVAVIGSAMMGTVTGQVTTNIIAIGSFTIPAMKRLGLPAHYAAAVETCASTGGVITPPIMGTVAFVLAGLVGIPYVQVALAAVIPAILYYLALFVQVDGQAVKIGLKGLPRKELPSLWSAVREVSVYGAAILALIFLLLYLRREAQAPFYATALLIVTAMVRKKTRLGWKDSLVFLQTTARMLGEITVIMVGVGLILGPVFITGLGSTISSSIVDLAGGNVHLMIIFGAITSYILGMGMSLLGCYIILAILLVPALLKMGIDPLAAHLFVLYCGNLSFLTPPVAIGAYVAANLAQASPMKTAITACRLGIVLFIIPVFFVLNPAFILHGTPPEILHVLVTGVIGVVLLASGVEGYLVGVGKLGLMPRAITVISGALIFYPSAVSEIIGAGIFVIFIGVSLLIRRLRLKR